MKTRTSSFFAVLLCSFSMLAATPSFAGEIAVHTIETPSGDKPLSAAEVRFRQAAKKFNIPTRKMDVSTGMPEGYHIIAGVFGNTSNARKFARTLSNKGIQAKVLANRENDLNYISIAGFKDWKDAINTCVSRLDGKYMDKVWILNIADPSAVKPVTKVDQQISKTQKTKASNANYFKSLARGYNIATRNMTGLKGVRSGYYLVAGVYGEQKNVKRALSKFRKMGLQPAAMTNPQNGLNYVYLEHLNNADEAINTCISKFDGKYREKVWILNVEPAENIAVEADAFTQMISEIQGNTNKRSTKNALQPIPGVKTKVSSKDPVRSKLLAKADLYFDKMWYAEAAKLYEQVLEQNERNYTFEIIQKAGDAHYFNTNMERAHHWYDILYSRFKSQMTAENLFKYAHSLKGTGKYARAKRLMRIYDRKVKKDSEVPKVIAEANAKEVVLDKIMSAEETFGIKNLEINSKYSDFAPMFHNESDLVFASAADSSFFSTRRYKWNNQPYLDLYVAKINEESDEVREATKFSKKINTKYHEASVAFSPDNKTMYFTRNNYGKKLKRDKYGVNHLKIYVSYKVSGEWSEARELPFNSDDYSTGHPALSPDGKQLYFVSDMPGSLGQSDIFVVDIIGDGQFSEPRNLGPDINTERREMFPFITEKKLYFASDGHVGLGGLDVYSVPYNEEEGFLEVSNLGKPINSNKDDFSYIINEETQKGYFASNRNGGKGDDDIYSFKKLILEEPSKSAIAGIVTDVVTGEVMPEALVVLLDENNRKLKEMVTGDDGSFVFEDLDGNTKYSIQVTKDGYFDGMESVTTRDNEWVEANIALKRLEDIIAVEDGIRKLKLNMIFFDFDKSNIRPDAAEELDKLVKIMNEYPEMVIAIQSHTDSRGSHEYNRYLSNRRARSTREYLIRRGISPARIESAIGYGEERLLNECDGSVRCSRAQHQLNRRSEFIIVKM